MYPVYTYDLFLFAVIVSSDILNQIPEYYTEALIERLKRLKFVAESCELLHILVKYVSTYCTKISIYLNKRVLQNLYISAELKEKCNLFWNFD